MPTFRFDKGGNALTTSLQVQRLLKVLKALSISLSSYTCNNHKIMTWLHKNLSRKPTFSHIFTITTPILVWKSKMQWKLSHLNSSPWEQNNHHCLRYCPAWKSVNYLLQYKAYHDIWKSTHVCDNHTQFELDQVRIYRRNTPGQLTFPTSQWPWN